MCKHLTGIIADGDADTLLVQKLSDSIELYVEYFQEYVFADGGERNDFRQACQKLRTEILPHHLGRGRYAELGETEDLLIPPSAALAGSVYKTVMAQVTAGKKYGSMSEVDGVAFNLKKSEISEIEKIGLIPMVKEYGKVMAFSAKTLFNGDNLGLQTYSVVRVFDWVTKVLMDFLNRRAFENWNSKAERDLRGQISKFLDSIQGPGRLIEKFKILRFERDPKQKDRIFLDIHLTPYFPAKSFVIKLEGTKGDDENDWNSDYAQDA